MRIELPGIPIEWKRPEQRSVRGKTWRFDGQKDLKLGIRRSMLYQVSVMLAIPDSKEAREAHTLPLAKDLHVSIAFYFPPNKSDSRPLKNAKKWGLVSHSEKPDWDNLAKFYMDCGNGILWPDDKAISSAVVKKKFSENPRTIIEIMPKENLNMDPNARKILEIIGPEKLIQLGKDIQKFDYLTRQTVLENSDEGDGVDKPRWQSRTALLLAEFAYEYGPLFMQINKVGSRYIKTLPQPLC